ncbi:hypothetical protein [Marinobacterium sp. MBR-109]|jgi:hypothetical protein|uniref:hypothetical protein n=1 Tax=Marinobacterium sp. MBR-109 TaxID=3156462 RepID=UPI00339A2F00
MALFTSDTAARSGHLIKTAFFEFLILSALVLIPPLLIYTDLKLFHDNLGENSLTEYVQALCLLLVILLFARTTWQQPNGRGFYVLVTGFFLCMLVREHDYLFDLISHGWWKYPALAVTLVALLAALGWRHTVIDPMAEFTRMKGYPQLLLGLVIVLVFSRVFGTGSLWRALMETEYQNLYKSVIQEGLELLGYLLIAYGTVLMCGLKNSRLCKPAND